MALYFFFHWFLYLLSLLKFVYVCRTVCLLTVLGSLSVVFTLLCNYANSLRKNLLCLVSPMHILC